MENEAMHGSTFSPELGLAHGASHSVSHGVSHGASLGEQQLVREYTYQGADMPAPPHADGYENGSAGAGAPSLPVHSELKRFRLSKRESQEKFWGRFGVTQSSGSRFETGLGIPAPVAILVKLYVKGKLSDGDLPG